jgi:Cd2+/Zn2+-exporting ATPase
MTMNDQKTACNCQHCQDACETPHKSTEIREIKFHLKREIVIISISVLFLITAVSIEAYFKTEPWIIVKYLLFLASYTIAGYEVLGSVFRNVVRNFRHFEFFDENFLMFIATIGAIFTNNMAEAVAVMMFYKVGQTLENYSVTRSRKSIQALLNLRPDSASVKKDGVIIIRSPQDVEIGDIIFVKPGEKVPLDGILLSKESFFDTSALTGESVPRRIRLKEQVLAGMINTSNAVDIQVTRRYDDSSIAKILELVEHAETSKSKTVKFITKFARFYTPIVVLSAVLLAIIPPLLIPGARFSDWIYRAMIFLLISCPCALVLSIPLSYFAAIGGASRKGILIKGAHHLDTLSRIQSVVFDKTGTITKGVFKVSDIVALDGSTDQKILKLLARAEANSSHPIAKSILDAYGSQVDTKGVSDFTEIPAHGILAMVDGQQLIAGNDKILHKFNIDHADNFCTLDGTVVHVAVDHNYVGYVLISDEKREDSASSLKELRKLGINELVLLSGDDKCIVEDVAHELGFSQFQGGLLPEDKVDQLQVMRKNGDVVAFVGDGINDAPVIAGADLGIAMGGLGSDAAIETADVVLMTDSLSKVPLAIRIARKARTIIWQNILVIFIVKVIFLGLGAFGLMTMWGAVFADVGLTAITVLNAMRALRVHSIT